MSKDIIAYFNEVEPGIKLSQIELEDVLVLPDNVEVAKGDGA